MIKLNELKAAAEDGLKKIEKNNDGIVKTVFWAFFALDFVVLLGVLVFNRRKL